MRKTIFLEGEYYHIYNRGVDKRDIILDYYDLDRFIKSLEEFNNINPIGSIYENKYNPKKELGNLVSKLVDIVAFSINPNHFHFILTPKTENGIQKFMHRVGLGYTKYFNEKYKRSGSLFQGVYKSKYVNSNEYLLHLSAYINLNNIVHAYSEEAMYFSTFKEYMKNVSGICNKSIVLDQFESCEKYVDFATSAAQETFNRREMLYLET